MTPRAAYEARQSRDRTLWLASCPRLSADPLETV